MYFQARALAAHTAETEKINFLVGTQSLRRTNQVKWMNIPLSGFTKDAKLIIFTVIILTSVVNDFSNT